MEDKFWYCHGITLDGNYCEKICKKRENCKYYDVDFYSKYRDILDKCDFLVCFEPCKYYSPKREEVSFELSDDEDPFAPLMQHDMK